MLNAIHTVLGVSRDALLPRVHADSEHRDIFRVLRCICDVAASSVALAGEVAGSPAPRQGHWFAGTLLDPLAWGFLSPGASGKLRSVHRRHGTAL